MSIEWQGAPTRIAHNCLRARPEARVAIVICAYTYLWCTRTRKRGRGTDLVQKSKVGLTCLVLD